MLSLLHLILLQMLELFSCCARASMVPGTADMGEHLVLSAHLWV